MIVMFFDWLLSFVGVLLIYCVTETHQPVIYVRCKEIESYKTPTTLKMLENRKNVKCFLRCKQSAFGIQANI